MNLSRVKNGLIVVFCILIALSAASCAHKSGGTSSNITLTKKIKPQLITLNEQPPWLMIGEQNNGGDIFSVKGSLYLYGSPYEYKSYDENDQLTLQFLPNNKIAYISGKGEIIKVRTHERIVLPLTQQE